MKQFAWKLFQYLLQSPRERSMNQSVGVTSNLKQGCGQKLGDKNLGLMFWTRYELKKKIFEADKCVDLYKFLVQDTTIQWLFKEMHDFFIVFWEATLFWCTQGKKKGQTLGCWLDFSKHNLISGKQIFFHHHYFQRDFPSYVTNIHGSKTKPQQWADCALGMTRGCKQSS